MRNRAQEIRIQGCGICKGIAIGKPFFFALESDAIPEYSITKDAIDNEIARYRYALQLCKENIEHLQKQLTRERVFEGLPILETYIQIIQDPLLTIDIEHQVRLTYKNVEFVFQAAINEYEERFNKSTNTFFKERFKDIQDISRRIINYLKRTVRFSFATVPLQSIVFAHEIVPSDIAEVDRSRVAAFITEVGGQTSHSAIIAQAKGIPYISHIDFQSIYKYLDRPVIVDGEQGLVIICPTAATMQEYRLREMQLAQKPHQIYVTKQTQSITADGFTLALSANIEMIEEITELRKHPGHDIGLFRSEYLFVAKKGFPSEDEQYQAYFALAQQMQPLPVVIRTFDIGGDKFTEHNPYGWQEANPFLGCRAIRLMLKNRDIFKQQLRAILRASIFGNISILFPMISSLEEVRAAKAILEQARQELADENIATAKLPIGCMIELPSAAIISDLLAKECDFFSIGTNDLVQYVLGVDRGNQHMRYLYSPAHPSVIRLLKVIVVEANRANIPVSVCGEIATDALYINLLVGLGVRRFSVALRQLATVKQIIGSLHLGKATILAQQALELSTAEEVQYLLQQYATQWQVALL